MKRYGIYNNLKKEFQFGINKPSKRKALKCLFSRIGNDARKHKFEIKELE